MADDNNLDSGLRWAATGQIEEGKNLAQSGDRVGARVVFRQIIHNDPYSEDAWLWLAYVAEDKEHSLRYLREARTLMPDSVRIVEGIRWAEQRLGRVPAPETGTTQRGPAANLGEATVRAKKVISRATASHRLDRAAQQVRQGAARVSEELKEKVASVRLPQVRSQRLRGAVASLISCMAIIGMFMFVLLGISNARKNQRAAQALALPTLVADATATPTVEQLAKPLWIQVDIAWTRENWDDIIDTLNRIRALDPRSQEARERLAEAHYYRGLESIDENRLDEAGLELDRAIRLNAGNRDLQQVRRDLKTYIQGLETYWEQAWPRVVKYLAKLYARNPDFRDTRVMLGHAYYHVGTERQEAEVWDEARDAFEAALRLLPDLEDAKLRLAQVKDEIIPPRRIELDISEKLITLYEEHQPIRVFVCCTGRRSAPTLPGRYQVLDKLPMAYASKWDLNMPWWLGIYWAGGSENGFHALPILSNGRTLWRGALGTGCSYGCIVLDTKDAITLYNWADVGTVVLVSP